MSPGWERSLRGLVNVAGTLFILMPITVAALMALVMLAFCDKGPASVCMHGGAQSLLAGALYALYGVPPLLAMACSKRRIAWFRYIYPALSALVIAMLVHVGSVPVADTRVDLRPGLLVAALYVLSLLPVYLPSRSASANEPAARDSER